MQALYISTAVSFEIAEARMIPTPDLGLATEDTVAGAARRVSLIGADRNTLISDICSSSGGPTAILLHGGGQSRSSWRIATQRLGNAQFKACALDLRGHGDSDWSPDGDYRIERFVADLVSVIEDLGSPAVLIGASFGGHVSLVTAARHPSLVRALVLCDVTPWIEGEATKAMRSTMCAAAAGFASVQDAANHIDEIRGFPSNLDANRLRRHMRQDAEGRLYWRWDPQFFLSQDSQNENLTELLTAAVEKLKVPTLLIRAEHSEIVTPDQIAKFARMVPHASTAEIAGARHTVSADDNEKYASLILEFLDGLSSH
jgi:pimeloyl-ACP methyl ester carboxylesterase